MIDKEVIAALLTSDRLSFYIGGSWQEEKKILGLSDEDENYFARHHSQIMAARAAIVVEDICKALERKSQWESNHTDFLSSPETAIASYTEVESVIRSGLSPRALDLFR